MPVKTIARQNIETKICKLGSVIALLILSVLAISCDRHIDGDEEMFGRVRESFLERDQRTVSEYSDRWVKLFDIGSPDAIEIYVRKQYHEIGFVANRARNVTSDDDLVQFIDEGEVLMEEELAKLLEIVEDFRRIIEQGNGSRRIYWYYESWGLLGFVVVSDREVILKKEWTHLIDVI